MNSWRVSEEFCCHLFSPSFGPQQSQSTFVRQTLVPQNLYHKKQMAEEFPSEKMQPAIDVRNKKLNSIFVCILGLQLDM